MAGLILPQRFVRQPQGSPPSVDPKWVSKGLKFVFIPSAGWRNLVNGTGPTQSQILTPSFNADGLVFPGGTRAEFGTSLDATKGLTLFSSWLAPGNYFGADGERDLLSNRTSGNGGWTWGRSSAGSGGSTGNVTGQVFTLQGIAAYSEASATIPAFVNTPVACRYSPSAGLISWFAFGAKSSSDTTASTTSSAGGNTVLGAQGDYPSNGTPWINQASYVIAFEKALTDAEIRSISLNPYQVFAAPQRKIWVAVASSGSGATLTGQTDTFAQGTLTPALSAALSAQTPTFAQGVVTPALASPLSAQSETFALGSVTPSVSAALTGQTLAGTQGSLSPSTPSGVIAGLVNLFPGKFTRQPQYTVGVSSSPLAKGLVSLYTPTANGFYDSAAGLAPSATNASTLAATPLGLAQTNNNLGVQFPTNPRVGAIGAGDCTVLVIVQSPNTGGTPPPVYFTAGQGFYFAANIDHTGANVYGLLTFTTLNENWVQGAVPSDSNIHTFAYTRTAASFLNSLYIDGAFYSSRTGVSNDAFTSGGTGSVGGSGVAGQGAGLFYLRAVWNRVLTSAEIAQVTQNPWQLFDAPTRKFGVAQGLIYPLGQTGTMSQGQLGPSISVGLTGISAAASLNSLSVGLSAGLVGQSGTFTQGFAGAVLSATLTGQTAAFAGGTVTPVNPGSISVQLTGLGAGFTPGNVGAAIRATLTGQASSFSQGSLGFGASTSFLGFSLGDLVISPDGKTVTFRMNNVGINSLGQVVPIF